MDVQIQSNETNNKHNKTYLEKSLQKPAKTEIRDTLLFIYLILKAI